MQINVKVSDWSRTEKRKYRMRHENGTSRNPSHENECLHRERKTMTRWAKTSRFCLITKFKRFEMSQPVGGRVGKSHHCLLHSTYLSTTLLYICCWLLVCVSRNIQLEHFFWHLAHLIFAMLREPNSLCALHSTCVSLKISSVTVPFCFLISQHLCLYFKHERDFLFFFYGKRKINGFSRRINGKENKKLFLWCCANLSVGNIILACMQKATRHTIRTLATTFPFL